MNARASRTGARTRTRTRTRTRARTCTYLSQSRDHAPLDMRSGAKL